MRFTVLRISLAGALCAALLVPAVAQQTDGTPPVAGKEIIGVSVAERAIVAEGWRASELLRSEVYNDKQEKIGKVDDLIIAPDGELSIAVVDVGGLLGIGRHRVAIPVRQFSSLEPARLVLPGASKDTLKSMPEFSFAR